MSVPRRLGVLACLRGCPAVTIGVRPGSRHSIYCERQLLSSPCSIQGLQSGFSGSRNTNAPASFDIGASHGLPGRAGWYRHHRVIGILPIDAVYATIPANSPVSLPSGTTKGIAAPCRRLPESGGVRVEIQTHTQTQALSRPDNLAHDIRKESLGKREYPAARLLAYRSWGKGRNYGRKEIWRLKTG